MGKRSKENQYLSDADFDAYFRGKGSRNRRSKKRKKRLITLSIVFGVIAVLILAAVIAVTVFLGNLRADRDGSPVPSSGEKIVTIEIKQGQTAADVAQTLADLGVIKYPWYFRLEAGDHGVIVQKGTFEIPFHAGYEEIFEIITAAPEYRPSVRITFPEGCEVSDVIDLFLEKGIGTREGFESAVHAAYPYSYLPEPGTANRLEGFLYPETYDFFLDSTPVDVIGKMLAEFDSRRIAANISEEDIYEALILGSIIQKESGNPADFAMISSVFNNRLDIDMRLQSDAATNYPIPKDERLPSCTAAQLAQDTPYNVYIHYGLTPTPICNPRIEAVSAAMNPAESEYLYFIGTPDGQTIFAKTYSEHKKNIDQYLK